MANDDLILAPDAANLLQSGTFCIEEKLDGFNLAITWDDAGWPQPYARSGKTNGDRGGQLGLVRAWIAGHAPALQAVLADWPVLYAEWLRLRHSAAYDRLPDWLVVLDLWHPERGFAPVAIRNALCARAGLAVPQAYATSAWPGSAAVEAFCQHSHYSTGRAEGVILRNPAGGTQGAVAKCLAADFRRISDTEWRAMDNALAGNRSANHA
ncbi:MAG: RNA ligase family protein [Deltaproteobacteria bacterium]|nr:RNA ligase family protein [Deltaproteobacteria bacterium]